MFQGREQVWLLQQAHREGSAGRPGARGRHGPLKGLPAPWVDPGELGGRRGLPVFLGPGWSGGLLSWQWPQGSALSKFHVCARGGRAVPAPCGPAPDTGLNLSGGDGGAGRLGPWLSFLSCVCVAGGGGGFSTVLVAGVSFSLTDLERSCWADRPHSPHRDWMGGGPLESGGEHTAPQIPTPWTCHIQPVPGPVYPTSQISLSSAYSPTLSAPIQSCHGSPHWPRSSRVDSRVTLLPRQSLHSPLHPSLCQATQQAGTVGQQMDT